MLFSYIFDRANIFSFTADFLPKYLHNMVPCNVVYQIKVIILMFIFIEKLSKPLAVT